jgi:hypothetical protein
MRRVGSFTWISAFVDEESASNVSLVNVNV